MLLTFTLLFSGLRAGLANSELPIGRVFLNEPVVDRRPETILIVEDESELLRLIALALRRVGYNVLEASTCAEGLSICERTGILIDLVLSDYNMPGANGMVLAEKLREFRPSVAIIFMSGNLTVHDEVTGRGFVCLKKPFSLPDLEHTVRETLTIR